MSNKLSLFSKQEIVKLAGSAVILAVAGMTVAWLKIIPEKTAIGIIGLLFVMLLGNPSADMLISGDISVILRDTGLAERPITRHLITIGEPIIDHLKKKLHEENWTIRYHATLILGEIGSVTAVPDLIRLFHIYLNVEGAQTARNDVKRGMKAIITELCVRSEKILGEKLPFNSTSALEKAGAENR